MKDWLEEWSTKIRPLRERLGFQVVGAWTAEGNEFIWILRYEGPDSWEAADAAYYRSPERKAIAPDPARLIERSETRMMTAI